MVPLVPLGSPGSADDVVMFAVSGLAGDAGSESSADDAGFCW